MQVPALFQVTIAATSAQLPANPVNKSVTFTAKSTNTGVIGIGTSSSVTTSNGYVLEKGNSITIPMGGNSNTAIFYVIGTAADILSVSGV